MTVGPNLRLGQSAATIQANYVNQGLGIFLHFNLDTFLDTDGSDGSHAVNTFNPSALSIDQWITNISAAKARYAVLTVKHISGFCLWPSLQTTYNVSTTTWYTNNSNLDIASSFATKCRNANINPVFYFCVKDNNFEINNPSPSQALYKSFSEAQLRELLNNYGSIGGIWVDANNTAFFGSTGYPWASVNECRAFIHGQKPTALCIDNDRTHPNNNTSNDIVVYEGGNTPGDFVAGGNAANAECCETINADSLGAGGAFDSWFWKSTVPPFKNTSTLISNIATANSRNSSYLINFPPDNTGNIESRMQTVMAAIGAR